jgi:hypothetical protein
MNEITLKNLETVIRKGPVRFCVAADGKTAGTICFSYAYETVEGFASLEDAVKKLLEMAKKV